MVECADAYQTTLIDLYRFNTDFPGHATAQNIAALTHKASTAAIFQANTSIITMCNVNTQKT